ncbi:hypothetical protein JCM10213_001432 [Rhodosporidiobolus nylandii]
MRSVTAAPTRVPDNHTPPRPEILPRILRLVQPATLTSLTVLLEPSDIPTIALIPRFVNLAFLHVLLHTPATSDNLVPQVLGVVGTLHATPVTFSIQDAVLRSRPLDTEPLPAYPLLTTFLAAVPTNVCFGVLKKLYVRTDALPPPHSGVQPDGERSEAYPATRLQLPVDAGDGPVERQLFRGRDGAWYSMSATDEEER